MSTQLIPLSQVTARLGLPDTTDDATLQTIILAVGARFENDCQRKFVRTEADTWEGDADYCDFSPPRYPIEEVISFDLKRTEREGWVPQPQVDFIIVDGTIVRLYTGPLGLRTERVRLTYTGGYVIPPAVPADSSQTALPDDLILAALDQTVAWYQNRNRLGISAIGSGDGHFTRYGDLDLLPHVKAILGQYKRIDL